MAALVIILSESGVVRSGSALEGAGRGPNAVVRDGVLVHREQSLSTEETDLILEFRRLPPHWRALALLRARALWSSLGESRGEGLPPPSGDGEG